MLLTNRTAQKLYNTLGELNLYQTGILLDGDNCMVWYLIKRYGSIFKVHTEESANALLKHINSKKLYGREYSTVIINESIKL